MHMGRHKENKRQTSLLKQLIAKRYTNLCIFRSFARPPYVSYARCTGCGAERCFCNCQDVREAFIKGIGSQEMIPFVAMRARIPCALSERGFQKSPQDSSELSRPFSR